MRKNKDTKEKRSSGIRREWVEWGVIIVVIGGIYVSGYHTEVIGQLQRLLLLTGLRQPDIEQVENSGVSARYDMPMTTLAGDGTSLAEFEGKTIFLNFWATWCPPCIAEMPNIQSLYESLDQEQDIVFVMVSLDEDRDKARAFMQRKEYTLPVYFLEGRRPGVYNSTIVPTTYVIDPDGNIALEERGMAKYDTDTFREFLKGL
ncbi:MAG: TlpA disulfide reductase family protein [Bacteroidota bacterium]